MGNPNPLWHQTQRILKPPPQFRKTKNREVPPPESSEAFSLPFLSPSLPSLAPFTTGAGRSGFPLLIMPQLLTLPIRESPSILRATKTQISTNTFLQYDL